MEAQILPGAYQTNQYFPLIKGKKIGLVINQGSRIQNQLLLDSLVHAGFQIGKIFVPEHGLRGNNDAGESIENQIDSPTGIPIISLYGKHISPDSTDLSGLDLIIFDLQDVGVRFYTYLSTLHYVLKACIHFQKPFIILDRPNPNIEWIDGPILEPNYKSFIGLDPVPILYGMTIGEYGQMLLGENWIEENQKTKIQIIRIKNYTHHSFYSIPIPPSPNLPNDQAIYLYPSLCLFEGTQISIGRGTPFPFQVFGSPDLMDQPFSFTPMSIIGKSKHPPYENKTCYGVDLRNYPIEIGGKHGLGLKLDWIRKSFQAYQGKSPFFNSYFNKLSGEGFLAKDIQEGKSDLEIRRKWKKGLEHFKSIRKKYLLYP